MTSKALVLALFASCVVLGGATLLTARADTLYPSFDNDNPIGTPASTFSGVGTCQGTGLQSVNTGEAQAGLAGESNWGKVRYKMTSSTTTMQVLGRAKCCSVAQNNCAGPHKWAGLPSDDDAASSNAWTPVSSTANKYSTVCSGGSPYASHASCLVGDN